MTDGVLTEENLAEMESRVRAATKAPWSWSPSEWDCGSSECPNEHDQKSCKEPIVTTSAFITPFLVDMGEYMGLSDDDAEFIADARADVPNLIASHRLLQRRVEKLEGLLEHVTGDVPL